MRKGYDVDNYLIWPIVLIPVFHFGHSLETAPWDAIKLRFNGLSSLIEHDALASLHAAANWTPSPLFVGALVLWAIAIGASVAMWPRRVRDRSNKSWSGP